MKTNNIVAIGDFMADVYINCTDIARNQEIINCLSLKAHHSEINVLCGGLGILLSSLSKQIKNHRTDCSNACNSIKYYLPNVKNINLMNGYFNKLQLYNQAINKMVGDIDLSITGVKTYNKCTIDPTIKTRFFSKKNFKIFFRYDIDNQVQLSEIDYCELFSVDNKNSLILIDYDKGVLNNTTINKLLCHLRNNNLCDVDNLFINTKPHKIELYEPLIKWLSQKGTRVIIQLNESEYKPIKNKLKKINYTYLIVTRGTKSIHLYKKGIQKKEKIKVDNYLVDFPTTSGCGDMFFSSVIYYFLYKESNIFNSIDYALSNMKLLIESINSSIFC